MLDENTDGVSSSTRSLPYYHNAYIHADLTYANGSPAEGYLLKVQPVNAVVGPIEGTSGPDGIVLLNISHYSFGPSFVWVEDGSGAYRWRGSTYVEPDGEYDIDIMVQDVPRPFTRVTGYIRNGTSGAPLEGYTINVVAFDHLGNMEMYTDQSDPQGRYILRVPNTTLPCQLSISGMGEFYYFTTSFQPEYQQEQFDLDIKMLPLYVPDVPVKLTYRNASTGEKLSSGKLRVYGHNTDLGHQTYSRSNLMPDGSGDYSLLMGPGEYRARWESYLDPYWMVEYDVTSNFYVGSSIFSLEVPLDMPGMIPVELEVWNGTGPLYNAIVSYSHTLDTDQGDIEVVLSYKPTNLSGKLFFGAPEDTLLDLTLHRGGYVTRGVPLNTTGASGTISINTTMDQEEIPTPRPRGNLSVTVVDEVTGIPLPDVLVMAYRDLHPGTSGTGSYTDDNGELVMDLPTDIYDVTAESSLGRGGAEGIEVYEGMITEVTIHVERYDPVTDEYGYTVHVKDEGGDPLPNQLVSIECRDLPGYDLSILSDNHGNVSFVGPRGTYLIYLTGSNPSSYGQSYSSPYRFFELSGEGGFVPDIIGYPAAPMVEVQGFAYDLETMESMAQVQITATSVKDVGGNTRNGDPEDLVHLDTMNVGSTSTGFYRTWGRDTLILEAFEDGYFPYYEEIDMSTRAPGDHDILMEELVDFDILVNGTLRDQDYRHIPGT
ncbi:MAG: hypothetical protein KAH57_08045, partial [Thermoplasmata archaeon]|nr:hypothetical protein [Thermoplasmata archaeon]